MANRLSNEKATAIKYCGDCVCLKNNWCRAYRNKADSSNTACLTPPNERKEQSYNIYPAIHKCLMCKETCVKAALPLKVN